MENENNSEAAEFWKEKEDLYGGKIEFRSFARYLGNTVSGSADLSGLLYLVNGRLIFEDFEKEPSMFGFLIKKKKSVYEKTLIEIPASEIRDLNQVSQGTSAGRMAGIPGPSQPISALARIFSVVVRELNMNDGNAYYFEILDKSSLAEALGKK